MFPLAHTPPPLVFLSLFLSQSLTNLLSPRSDPYVVITAGGNQVFKSKKPDHVSGDEVAVIDVEDGLVLEGEVVFKFVDKDIMRDDVRSAIGAAEGVMVAGWLARMFPVGLLDHHSGNFTADCTSSPFYIASSRAENV